MTRRVSMLAGLFALACLLLLPSAVDAQSTFAGTVKDASGGVLPGVTVEASSDALIEKVKVGQTDGNGQFRIIDLRPGAYVVTFTLTGFQTLRRDGIELPTDFTATLNVDMRVGAIEETITVSGAAPIVDVQSAAAVMVLDKDAIDNIPSGRTIQGLGQLIPGVNLSLPDVGGSRAAMQTYMSVHGQSAAQNTVMVDGLTVNGLEANGAVQNYFNDAASQEISYQTAGVGADRSGGGVSLNMIPREGGNRLSGDSTVAFRPGAWQGDNLTQRLQDAGLQAGNATDYIYDFTVSQGGPIQKDKLWFFGTYRDYRTNNFISNTVFDDGSQGDDYNYIKQGLVRLTYQLGQRNKLSAYYDRVDKYRAHDMQSLTDPETASVLWTAPNYSTGALKWTSTISSRLLAEAGYSQNVEYRNTTGQDGIVQARGTAPWFATASRTITPAALGTRTTAPATYGSQQPLRQNFQASASYVTGSHTVKVGGQWQWGRFVHRVDANADLVQTYSSFARVGNEIVFSSPSSVIIRNTPIFSQESMNADLGVYAQDSWRLKRLTLNYGVRWEWLNSQVDETTAPAGRFVPERTQPELKNIPNWKDFAPRLQAVYDLFGNSRTAIKASFNRYNTAQTTSLAAGFNGLGSTTSTRTWTDLNGDNIAQGQRTWNANGTFTDCVYLTPGCEINLSGTPAQGALSPTFGLLAEADQFGNFDRPYSLETGVEVQHELLSRLSVTGSWYRTTYHNLTKTVNLNRRSIAEDYVPLTIYNPIDGTPITYYNSTAAFQARPVNNLAVNEPLRQFIYNSFATNFAWRPKAGTQIFGGVAWERSHNVDCGTSIPNAVVDPNTLRFCDERETGKPFAVDFRLGISYALPYGITFGASFQHNDEGSTDADYTFSRSIRYPDGSRTYLIANQAAPACPAPCTPGAISAPTFVGSAAGASVELYPDGTVDADRLKQLDVKFSKTFRLARVNVIPTFEAFNVFNADTVITYASQSYANSAGTHRRPNSILQGRILGVGARVRW